MCDRCLNGGDAPLPDWGLMARPDDSSDLGQESLPDPIPVLSSVNEPDHLDEPVDEYFPPYGIAAPFLPSLSC